ncbi:uncharacterized protein LOC5667122 [Anopheles gambiae]|uniref:Uncharacterized protein n=1 Tax=Anopheles coluzzii TaxID=1518534 RepID=A0A6E8VQS6_ANOCL|nr:uncharacterized protein LOC5667122 [Anopheles gambiae]XP_040223270.2 uncharacterized protein LOC120949808 [Anopheles coluzzii]
MTPAASFVLSAVLLAATSFAIPVAQNGTGLGAALTNIANSFVVVSEDVELEPHPTSSGGHGEESVVPEAQSVLHLESANVLPSLVHISLTPEEHHIKAETAELVYTNDTDAQGVVKITIVSEEEDFSGDSTTDTATVREEDDDAVTTEETTTGEEDELTTLEPQSSSSSSATTVGSTAPPEPILTVLGADEVDKDREEEIKENIKEVEAMPVILTVGV